MSKAKNPSAEEGFSGGGHDHPQARSLQNYIDETPRWADGTDLPTTPMTRMQWLIWGLAAAGKFFEGMVVFMTGVALPLLSREFGLGEFEHGLAAAAGLLGILLGATLLGSLSDRYGRKRMFIVEMALFTLFLALICFSPNFPWFVICLLGMGIALGCAYPTAHVIISEAIPSRSRGRLVLSAFGFQAVGALFGTVVGYLILANLPEISAWRWMYAVAVIPAILVLAGRFFITESGHWLLAQGRLREAEAETARLLDRHPPYPKSLYLRLPQERADARLGRGTGLTALFKRKNRRATILAAAVGHQKEHATSIADIVHNDMLAARGAAIIDVLLIVGIVFAVLLTDRIGRIRLQILGFLGCAVGLLIAALSVHFDGGTQMILIFAGFMLFNFMTNIGPNAQTYLIAGEVFPTRVRGLGAGLAASVGKVGAVITAFLFPILMGAIGTELLLYGLVVTCLLGALVTWAARIETSGRNLEDLE